MAGIAAVPVGLRRAAGLSGALPGRGAAAVVEVVGAAVGRPGTALVAGPAGGRPAGAGAPGAGAFGAGAAGAAPRGGPAGAPRGGAGAGPAGAAPRG
ncbi:hypothetical protein ACFPK1_14540, partial [Actinomycetospora rhizophila]